MSRASEHFADEVCSLINRFRLEYDLTYPEAIGALEMVKFDLLQEAFEIDGSDCEDEED